MQNYLGELNLIYYLIYLDNIVVFLHTAEEHLHQLHIVFDSFREQKLKLKLSKCNCFREEITYLAHQASKDGVWSNNLNLRVIAECVATSNLHRHASKDGLGAVLLQKQADGQYHPVTYGSRSAAVQKHCEEVAIGSGVAKSALSLLTPFEQNYHLDIVCILGIEVGSYRTFQGVPTLSTFPGKDQ